MGRWALFGVIVVVGLVPARAEATFPGQDGRIAYSLEKDDALFGADIATIQPDGSGFQRLTDVPGFASNPAWSPDGSQLAFTLEDQGHLFLYVMAADGSDQRAVTEIQGVYRADDASPSFSRDGERIAYSTGYAIRTIRPDGTGAETVYPTPDVFDPSRGYGLSYPVYSPDGKRIAFVRSSPERDKLGIWTVKSDGTRPRHILGPRRKPRPMIELDYSPDGKRIVFLFGSRGPYVVRPDGTHLRRFRPLSLDYVRPEYSPSGGYAVASRPRFDVGMTENCGDLYRIALDGSGEQQVTTNCDSYRGPTASQADWQPLPG